MDAFAWVPGHIPRSRWLTGASFSTVAKEAQAEWQETKKTLDVENAKAAQLQATIAAAATPRAKPQRPQSAMQRPPPMRVMPAEVPLPIEVPQSARSHWEFEKKEKPWQSAVKQSDTRIRGILPIHGHIMLFEGLSLLRLLLLWCIAILAVV
jgi:hypothetical protein